MLRFLAKLHFSILSEDHDEFEFGDLKNRPTSEAGQSLCIFSSRLSDSGISDSSISPYVGGPVGALLGFKVGAPHGSQTPVFYLCWFSLGGFLVLLNASTSDALNAAILDLKD